MTRSLLTVIAFVCWLPSIAAAQIEQRLSVSPTLFEMSAEREQVWQSNVRVINPNPYELTVYAQVVNFAPKGEGGDGSLLPVLAGEETGATLAEWVTITNEPIVIPREQALTVPFTVRVPADASPGGHFAAILIGTRPPTPVSGSTRLQTAQIVSSLFFVRVAGEVVESGLIREFRTTERFFERPSIDFELRFENKGNVHLQPQGDIRIMNMWGQLRGVVPINQQTHFGNVLPQSIRKFTFSWTGEWSVADIGRYEAVVTLGYGKDERHFVSTKTYFWVLPLRIMLAVALGVAVAIYISVWLIKLYVRRMLTLAGIDPQLQQRREFQRRDQAVPELRLRSYRTMTAPVRSGVADLFAQMRQTTAFTDTFTTLVAFFVRYRLFFAGITFFILIISALVWYVQSATVPDRAYQVAYPDLGPDVTVSSDELQYEALRQEQPAAATDTIAGIHISIINRSGISDLGARWRILLEDRGYEVRELSTDLSEQSGRTVVVFSEAAQSQAVALSEILGGALLSAFNDEADPEKVVLYLGSDARLE